MAVKVDVKQVDKRSGVKAGVPWAMTVLQAVLTADDGNITVGEIVLPKDHPEVALGVYTPTVRYGRDRGGRIQAFITRLIPDAARKPV